MYAGCIDAALFATLRPGRRLELSTLDFMRRRRLSGIEGRELQQTHATLGEPRQIAVSTLSARIAFTTTSWKRRRIPVITVRSPTVG